MVAECTATTFVLQPEPPKTKGGKPKAAAAAK
jgi:hypothetical protein